MLGFHSQNVLQILENMKPIIFLLDLPLEQGECPVFNSILGGMTGQEAFNLLVRTTSANDAEPVIPIIRSRTLSKGNKIHETDTVGIVMNVVVMNVVNYPILVGIRIFLPCIPLIGSKTSWQSPIQGQGDGSSIQSINITANGVISMDTI